MGARRTREAALHEVLQAAELSPKLLLLTRCPHYLARLRWFSSAPGQRWDASRATCIRWKGWAEPLLGHKRCQHKAGAQQAELEAHFARFMQVTAPRTAPWSASKRKRKRRVLFCWNKGRIWRKHRLKEQRSDGAVHRYWHSKRWLPSRKAAESNPWYSLFIWTSQPEQEAQFLQFIWDKQCCLHPSFKGMCKGTNTQPPAHQQTLRLQRK